MKLPHLHSKPLTPEEIETWKRVFLPTKGTTNDKTVEQSLWRRNQTEANKLMSGWQSPEDKARKIVYYKHTYDTVEQGGNTYLALASTYVYCALTLKKEELDKYHQMVSRGIENGGWKTTGNGTYLNEDLKLTVRHFANPHSRPREYDKFPEGYSTLEIELKSRDYKITNEQETVWHIAQEGLRKSAKRTNPTYIQSFEEILEYLPCQIEVGCGPSYEAGVDPLHVLHDIYSINEPFTKKFIIDADHDTFIRELVAEPERSYERTAGFYSKIITAKLTKFYQILKQLYERGYAVGPILTNNFDGLHLRVGIPEIFIRTYEEVVVLPDFQFDQRAKSLLVIGCHADRRGIERRARERGLKIIYIDPEGWWVDGEFISYPLESPQEGDFIYKKGANEAFADLSQILKLNEAPTLNSGSPNLAPQGAV